MYKYVSVTRNPTAIWLFLTSYALEGIRTHDLLFQMRRRWRVHLECRKFYVKLCISSRTASWTQWRFNLVRLQSKSSLHGNRKKIYIHTWLFGQNMLIVRTKVAYYSDKICSLFAQKLHITYSDKICSLFGQTLLMIRTKVVHYSYKRNSLFVQKLLIIRTKIAHHSNKSCSLFGQKC
jgi:hypothetical protein